MISLIQCLLLCNEFFFSKGQDHSKEIPDSFSHLSEYADSFCLSVTRICTAYYSCEFSFYLQVDKILYEYMFVSHKCFENTVHRKATTFDIYYASR